MHPLLTVKNRAGRTFFNSSANKKNSFLALLLFLVCFSNTYNLFAQSGTGSTILACPADIVATNEPGVCGARVTFAATITNGETYNLTYSKSSGALFPVGTTTVEVKVTDLNAVTLSACSFNITVLDKEAPTVVSCPSNIFVNNTPGLCGAVVNYTKPAFAELCGSQSKTYNFSGTRESFVVPQGVTSIDVDLSGASGGRVYSNGVTYGQPGFGGQVNANIPVVAGQVLYIYVGGAGQNGIATAAGTGGFNGGGNGGTVSDNTVITYASGGGGGASDIRTSGTALSDRIIVAGGGGAAGITDAGGNGGSLKGQDGFGGTYPATGGTINAGGNAGNYADSYFGGNGSFGVGGAGAAEAVGGGGGGGFFGGGGGSLGSGAGGSSYTSVNAKNVYHTQGSREGNGVVKLSWYQPVTVAQTRGLDAGAVFPVGTTVNTFTATDAAGNSSQCSFAVTVVDNEKPVLQVPAGQVFNMNLNSYTIPALAARDNCRVATTTYTVSGATVRTGTGVDASGSFNAGTSVISWSVSDVNGNVGTATTSVNVTVTSPVKVSIPDIYAVSPGGKANTIYIGYGPSTVSINAIAEGGTAPYSYRWSKSGTTNVLSETANLAVLSAGEYEVTVTDVTGAANTAKKVIQSVDVRCGNNNDKVLVCQPRGNSKLSSSCVKEDAVPSQLAKGAILGDCSPDAAARIAFEEKPNIVVEAKYKVDVFPNPSSGLFSVQLSNFSGTKAEVILLSSTGTTIERKTIEIATGKQTTTFNINKATPGVYVVKVISDNGVQTAKVVFER